MARYEFIDTDTHITEPPDLWTSRAPAHLKDKVPFVVTRDDGNLAWVVGGKSHKIIDAIGITAMAGYPGTGGYENPPKTYEAMHPAAWQSHARLEYMDQQRIWGMVMYPNAAGFGNHNFLNLKDPDLMLRCVQIYNDFQTEFASADSRRLLPISSIPFWDVKATVKEIRRCHAMGHKGILFTGTPEAFGMGYFSDPRWDPLWEVAAELDLPFSFHIGSGGIGDDTPPERIAREGARPVFAANLVPLTLTTATHMSNLIMSGVLIRYPTLKFVSVESSIGWIPYMLDTLDFAYRQFEVTEKNPEFEMLPSEYFKRNIFACNLHEKIPPGLSVDNILFETDFPHPGSLYGKDLWQVIDSCLGKSDETVRRKVLFENAQKLFKVELPTAKDEARLAKILAEGKPFWTAAA
jgi:predicted TIM-barrel fold metal-dependent hydrolase